MMKTVDMLYQNAENNGVLSSLEPFGKNVKITIPFTKTFCSKPIDELDLSVRARNGLMRAGVNTVEKLMHGITSEIGLQGIRNLGRKASTKSKRCFWSADTGS